VLRPSPAFAGASLLQRTSKVRFTPQDLHALHLAIFEQLNKFSIFI
jgi:hypothetical protein